MTAEHEHDWSITEVHAGPRGADRVSTCPCGAVAYAPGQAALRDRRPPLGTGDTWNASRQPSDDRRTDHDPIG